MGAGLSIERLGRIDHQTIMSNREDFPWLGMSGKGIGEYLDAQLAIFEDFLVPQNAADIARATLETTDAGAFNPLYTAVATMQLAQQQNFLGFVPKQGYMSRGRRLRTARGISSATGVAQSASIPAGIEGTYLEVDVGLKELLASVEYSIRMDIESLKNDAIRFESFVQDNYDDFLHATDVDMLADWATLAGNNIESADRLGGATTAAVTALGGAYGAADEDPWTTLDRSVVGTSVDAYLNHNSAVNRSLTREIINTLFTNLRKFWGKDSIDAGYYLTGTDTYTRWGEIAGAAWRSSEVSILNRLEGAEPVPGAYGGYKTNVWEGRPILLDDNVVVDGISRLYLFNRNKLWLSMGRPIEVIQGDNILYLNKTVKKSAFYGVMELDTPHPRALGCARDLA